MHGDVHTRSPAQVVTALAAARRGEWVMITKNGNPTASTHRRRTATRSTRCFSVHAQRLGARLLTRDRRLMGYPAALFA